MIPGLIVKMENARNNRSADTSHSLYSNSAMANRDRIIAKDIIHALPPENATIMTNSNTIPTQTKPRVLKG